LGSYQANPGIHIQIEGLGDIRIDLVPAGNRLSELDGGE
jgi:hypothetical protein